MNDLENLEIDKGQARQFAVVIINDITKYINDNPFDYISWLIKNSQNEEGQSYKQNNKTDKGDVNL